MITRTNARKTCAVLFAFILAMASPLAVYGRVAPEIWHVYESDSGVFRSRIPQIHTETTSSLALEDRGSVISEEISSIVDKPPHDKPLRSYIVKVNQTLGAALSPEEIDILLNRELGLYEDFYSARGGKVVEKHGGTILGFRGAEIAMSYVDPKRGEQYIKARILFSSSSRLEQIVIGTKETLNSYKTRDFYDSLVFADGISVTNKKVKDVWKPKTSALGLFTALAPTVVKPFFPQAPIIQKSPRSETMTFIFKDPVRNESLFYKIYGYKFNEPLMSVNAETVLKKNHLEKQRVNPKSIRFIISQDAKGRQVLDAIYSINAPKGFPFLETVKLRGIYIGDTMMVQEIISSRTLLGSPFANALFKMTEFHPELYSGAPAEGATPPGTPAQETESPLAEKLKGAISKDAKPGAVTPPAASAPPASP